MQGQRVAALPKKRSHASQITHFKTVQAFIPCHAHCPRAHHARFSLTGATRALQLQKHTPGLTHTNAPNQPHKQEFPTQLKLKLLKIPQFVNVAILMPELHQSLIEFWRVGNVWPKATEVPLLASMTWQWRQVFRDSRETCGGKYLSPAVPTQALLEINGSIDCFHRFAAAWNPASCCGQS